MNSDDYKEIKEMIHDILSGYQALTDSKLDMIIYRMDEINNKVDSNEVKTLKNEVSIQKLELENVKHNSNCPQNKRIVEVEKFVSNNKNIKKFIYATVVTTGIVIAIVYNLLRLGEIIS